MARATVLIPTHDHGAIVAIAARSVLAQTFADLELLVIGDGAPDEARTAIEDIARQDERVRWFENPKGPRHGEVHRHRALQDATGEVVCYLSDDDLWLPDHLARMVGVLERADYASGGTIRVDADGGLRTWLLDLSQDEDREFLLTRQNWVPLSAIGHTLDAYRSLPEGWTTTPAGISTDIFFTRKFLSVPSVRSASSPEMTVLHFPAEVRTSVDEATLSRWLDDISDEAWRHTRLPMLRLEAVMGGWAASNRSLRNRWRELDRARSIPPFRLWRFGAEVKRRLRR